MNYTTLKSTVVARLRRASVPLIDTFIELAEARLFRDAYMVADQQGEVVITSGASVSLPADFAAPRLVSLTVDSEITLIPFTPLEDFTRQAGDVTGTPERYTITGNTIRFSPPTAKTGTLYYYQRPDGLSGSVVTNSLIERAADLYVAAVMAEAHRHYLNEERASYYDSLVAGLIESINQDAGRDDLPQDQSLGGEY